MSKLRFAVLVVAVLPGVVAGVPLAVRAQGPTDEQRAACQADFDRLCAGTIPGDGRIIACLTRQYAQLSSACKQVMNANKKQ